MRVISYAAFRSRNSARPDGFFSIRLPTVIRAAFALFPEWRLVIHHDESFTTDPYYKTLCRLPGRVELRHCGEATRLAESMLWRLKPIFETGVEYVLARDLDSLATPRERWTVEAFMRSGRAMHLINDSRAHRPPSGPYMLGGMVGFNVRRFTEVTGIRSWGEIVEWGENRGCNLDGYGGDQDVMNRMFHPLLRGDFHCPPFENGKAQIEPCPLTAEVEPLAMLDGWRFSEFIGHVFSNIDVAFKFYDELPSSQPIHEAEA